MKIIIAGDGKIGSTLTQVLSSEGYEITVIDKKPEALNSSIERDDVMTINGNCAALATLTAAGVKNADVLIATTKEDEINLLTCMTAKFVNPNIYTIARIRDPEYRDQVYELEEHYGITLLINPERHAAREISRLIEFPGFLHREAFAKDRVEIVELRIDRNSKLLNVRLADLNSITGCKVLVCTVVRDGKAIMPGGDFVLKENDRIYVTASTSVLSTLLKNLGIITRKISRVLLAGGGKITYYLAQMLSAAGIYVKIVDNDPARCTELAKELPNADIILGDASLPEVADSEHYSKYDALVSLTGSDETNIVVSLFAHDINVPTVITKLGRHGSMDILERLSIGSGICPQDLCGTRVLRYVRALKNQEGAAITVHNIASGMAEAAEFHVDATTKNRGIPLKNIKIRPNVLIASISHAYDIEISNGNSVFEEGDNVIVVSNKQTPIMQLNDIFL